MMSDESERSDNRAIYQHLAEGKAKMLEIMERLKEIEAMGSADLEDAEDNGAHFAHFPGSLRRLKFGGTRMNRMRRRKTDLSCNLRLIRVLSGSRGTRIERILQINTDFDLY